MTTSLIPLPKVSVSLTGAEFDPSITFDEWAAVLKQSVKVHEAVQWVIGDGINFGHRQWIENAPRGEQTVMRRKYEVALESLPYEYQTLRVFAYVASRVLTRINKLSFKHHRAVAHLDAKQQKKYLLLAEKEGLSVADLNEVIRSSEAEIAESDHRASDDLRPGIGAAVSQSNLWARTQLAAVGQWSIERCQVVATDTKWTAELHRAAVARLQTAGGRGPSSRRALQ